MARSDCFENHTDRRVRRPESPDIPSVLVELGFMSNNDDEKLMRSSAHLKRIARALRRSVDSYFDLVQSTARAN